MTWYGTGVQKTHVHARPDCPALHQRRTHPVRELPADMLRVNKLCKVCFTGQVSSLHVRCETCGHRYTRPCAHNGGVRVMGKTRLLWVWPEDALVRTLVNPMQP